jgi:glycolate oxidase FAD binding subunit
MTTPTAIELLAGPAWAGAVNPSETGAAKSSATKTGDTENGVAQLLVGLDGSAAEVQWMIGQLQAEWRAAGAAAAEVLVDGQADELWDRLREFPAAEAPLVIKASLLPSRTVDFVRLIQQIDPLSSIQAHAGTGVVIARFAQFPPAGVSASLIGRLHPAAVAAGGQAVVLSSAFSADLTRQAVWGGARAATEWMLKVKQQFDPENLLNPGRFIYGT